MIFYVSGRNPQKEHLQDSEHAGQAHADPQTFKASRPSPPPPPLAQPSLWDNYAWTYLNPPNPETALAPRMSMTEGVPSGVKGVTLNPLNFNVEYLGFIGPSKT